MCCVSESLLSNTQEEDDVTLQRMFGILTLDEDPVFGNSTSEGMESQVWTTSHEVFQLTLVQM